MLTAIHNVACTERADTRLLYLVLYFLYGVSLSPALSVVQSKEVTDRVLSVRVSGNTPGILQAATPDTCESVAKNGGQQTQQLAYTSSPDSDVAQGQHASIQQECTFFFFGVWSANASAN